MNRVRWQQIESIYNAALEKPSADRELFLAEKCGDDTELFNEVNSLLASHDPADEFLAEPAYELGLKVLVNPEPVLQTDQVIGNYKIFNLLGRGGMGEVYLAQDLTLKRRVALKFLSQTFSADPNRVRRFKQEARTASLINHPNVAQVYEIGEVETIHFIAMEYVDGKTLREYLRQKCLNASEVLSIAEEIVTALVAAHEVGVVHRDLKPENVMLRDDGKIKVLDFSLAKLTQRFPSNPENLPTDLLTVSLNTEPGFLMGTATYMSPEQARGQEVDARTDIWSFGVMFYEMLTGELPFTGKTTSDMIAEILKSEPASLADFADEMPKHLERIILKSLSKELGERYQTSEELLDDLGSAKRELADYLKTRGSVEKNFKRRKALSSDGSLIKRTSEDFKIPTNQPETETARMSAGNLIKSRYKIASAVILTVITVFGLAFIAYRQLSRNREINSFQNIKISKLTNIGNADSPVISRDGKFVIYSKIEKNSKFSLWNKAIGASDETQILPPTEGAYSGAVISPDGKNIYFGAAMNNQPAAIYIMPVSGGEMTKLPLKRAFKVGLSPDGKRLAYMDNNFLEGKTSVVVANSDGTEARPIITRQAPDYFWTANRPSWSPDGKLIACLGQNKTESFPHVFLIDAETGKEISITLHKWNTARGIAWLSDMSGLLTIGADENSILRQIWHVPYPAGEPTQVSRDTNNYFDLSLAADGNAVVTTQIEMTSSIWVMPVDIENTEGVGLTVDTTNAVQINASKVDGFDSVSFDRGAYGRLSWTNEGRVIYTSGESGNVDIWSMNADGSDRKQLTTDPHWDTAPNVSPDGRRIVFMSNRAGTESIWIMDSDGKNQKRLTNDLIERVPFFSPDSKWVYFNSWKTGIQTVWKIPVEGGTAVQVIQELSSVPIISPDGRLIAYNSAGKIKIVDLERGNAIKIFDAGGIMYAWSPDGKALTYLSTINDITNLWIQPLDETSPRQLTDFASDSIQIYAFSKDGKQLAVGRGTEVSDIIFVSNLK